MDIHIVEHNKIIETIQVDDPPAPPIEEQIDDLQAQIDDLREQVAAQNN